MTVEEIQTLPDGPQRKAIEDDTNRRDEPVYDALSLDERLELLVGLGFYPGRSARRAMRPLPVTGTGAAQKYGRRVAVLEQVVAVERSEPLPSAGGNRGGGVAVATSATLG